VKTIVKTVSSPAKLTTAILTGGASVVAPKTFAPVTGLVKSTLFNPQIIPAVLTRNPVALLPGTGGAQPMGLNIGGLLGQVGTIFGGGQNQVFSGISNVANLASQFFPPRGVPPGPPSTQQPALPVMAAAGPVIRGMATVGRSFFNRFPNLATAIQGYRNMGKNVTRAKLYSLVRRFGPELVISGGILTAAAVNELLIAGPGHRRMNPANVKALRRSMRRLESFHHLCQRVDRLRGRRRGKKSGSGAGSTFVRQG